LHNLTTRRADINHHDELINSYDNSIRYNVDNFFKYLINADPTILDNTIILYTSDHGQTLLDNGETWIQCYVSKTEAMVPIFMITRNNYSVDTEFKASHFNLFATLLDLMNFPEAERRYHYAKSLLKARASESQDRYYYGGKPRGKGSVSQLINFDEQKASLHKEE